MKNNQQLQSLLEQTFNDRRLDQTEKSELFTQFQSLDRSQRAYVRNRAFDLVQAAQNKEPVAPLLRWLQAIIKSLDSSRPSLTDVESFFSPGDACANALKGLINNAKKSVDICVFTISDNTIRDALLASHAKNINIRIITDNDKSEDLGSDIDTLFEAGIKIRTDKTRHHMHHKFALFDQQHLVTGSFNWTRSASLYNHENLVLLEDRETINEFSDEFEKLWGRFVPHS